MPFSSRFARLGSEPVPFFNGLLIVFLRLLQLEPFAFGRLDLGLNRLHLIVQSLGFSGVGRRVQLLVERALAVVELRDLALQRSDLALRGTFRGRLLFRCWRCSLVLGARRAAGEFFEPAPAAAADSLSASFPTR